MITHKPYLPADLARTFVHIEERIPNIYTASAGGAAWTSAVAGWIDPTTVPEWSEVRVRNTDAGSQIWRALTDTNGNRQWERQA